MDKDEYLARGVAARDERVFEQLLDEYGGYVKAIVQSRLSGDRCLQEEAMQDIFVAVWRNIASFDAERSSLKNWICAISRYKCIDYMRRRAKTPCFSELDDSLPDERSDPQIQLEADSLLDSLPSADRELFYRRYILGEAIDQIANRRGQSAGLLYNRISRAKRRLRKQLEGK